MKEIFLLIPPKFGFVIAAIVGIASLAFVIARPKSMAAQLMCMVLSVVGVFFWWSVASAQMPVPLHDDARVEQGAGPQLEKLLLCKAGTKIVPADVESQFMSLGMMKQADGYLYPKGGARPVMFGDKVLRALVTSDDGDRKATVFLAGRSAAAHAKRLGVTKKNEAANTDDDSFMRSTSNKTTLYVGAADQLQVGNTERYERFDAAITCQVIR